LAGAAATDAEVSGTPPRGSYLTQLLSDSVLPRLLFFVFQDVSHLPLHIDVVGWQAARHLQPKLEQRGFGLKRLHQLYYTAKVTTFLYHGLNSSNKIASTTARVALRLSTPMVEEIRRILRMQYNKMDIVQVSEEYLWGINLHPSNWFIDRQILRSFRDLGESNILVLFDENGKLKQKENQLMKWLAPTDQAVATRYDRIKERLKADGIHLIPEVQEILKGAPQWSAEEIRTTGKQSKERYGVWTDGSTAIREQEQRAGYGVFWNFNNLNKT
jgi:hypothetical protein